MTIEGIPPLINKPWLINPGLTLAMFIYVQWHRQQRPKLILALTWWSLALLNGAGSNGSTLTPMVKEK